MEGSVLVAWRQICFAGLNSTWSSAINPPPFRYCRRPTSDRHLLPGSLQWLNFEFVNVTTVKAKSRPMSRFVKNCLTAVSKCIYGQSTLLHVLEGLQGVVSDPVGRYRTDCDWSERYITLKYGHLLPIRWCLWSFVPEDRVSVLRQDSSRMEGQTRHRHWYGK